MKKLIIMAVAMLLSVAAFAQDGKSIYSRYSGKEGVSSVYISPAMFRLMGKLPEMKSAGKDLDLSSILTSFSGLYLIESENKSINSSLKADVENAVKKGSYELLLEANDSGELVQLYTIGEDIVKSLIFYTVSGDEYTFISIDGNIKMSDLMEMISK